jgi:hypothetical protein
VSINVGKFLGQLSGCQIFTNESVIMFMVLHYMLVSFPLRRNFTLLEAYHWRTKFETKAFWRPAIADF